MKLVCALGLLLCCDSPLAFVYNLTVPAKVVEISRSWRTVRMRLPLNTVSRNPGGVMFGGFQAALADPVAALACSRVFPGYSCWTRAMSLDFQVAKAR